jgi:hypothetical protein
MESDQLATQYLLWISQGKAVASHAFPANETISASVSAGFFADVSACMYQVEPTRSKT